MILQVICAVAVTFAFALIFNIKGRNLVFTSIGGGIGWLAYLIAGERGYSTYTSYFIATAVIAVYSEMGARRLKTPVTTLLIAALIPLAPGGGVYKTMFSLISENFSQAAVSGMETLGIAGSMAIGIIIVTTLFQVYTNIKYGTIKLWINISKGRRKKVSKNQ